MKKKIIFVIMILASMLIVPSVQAQENYVASVDGTNYTTVQEAIDKANGKPVTLLTDVTESITIAKGTEVTLDLATHKLTNVAGKHTITNNGTLTITGNGTVDNVSNARGALVNYGTTTLENGTLTRSMEAGTAPNVSGGNSWYVMDNNGGTFTMNGGTVLGTSGYSSAIRNLGATFNMNGGEITNKFIALKNDDNGIINMTNGTVSTTKAGGSAIQNWGTLTMTGGTLNAAEGALSLYTLSWDDKYTQPTTTISGTATINGNIKIDVDGTPTKLPMVTVKGGSINGNITDVAGGKIVVTAGKITGKVTSEAYGTIQVVTADYSKVDELIAKFEGIDKTKYTEESLNKVETAIKNVDRSKNLLQQAEVDKMAADIEAAINGLQKITAEKVENPNTADINLAALLAMMMTGVTGLGYTLKKSFN